MTLKYQSNENIRNIIKFIPQILFTLGNISSFTCISYGQYIGFIIGVFSALIGIFIFRKDFWLMLTQLFYLAVNISKLFS